MKLGKNEFTTSLHNDEYVYKNDSRIIFRGKLDSLIALIGLIQSSTNADMLDDVLETVYNIMYAEITNTVFTDDKFICKYGDYNEIRDKSHSIGLLDHDKNRGMLYHMLNYLRTHIREAECAAIPEYIRVRGAVMGSIIQALNRLSSVIHIMMYEIVELEATT